MSTFWGRFRRECREIERRARAFYGVGRGKSYCKIRRMTEKQSRREGFAYYVDGTTYFNRAVRRLLREDRTLIATHEIVGHHLNTRVRGERPEERCASECEESFSKKEMGVSDRIIEDWRAYRVARMR